MKHILTITGVAPHSLGESFVRLCVRGTPNANLIAIDLRHSPVIDRAANARKITFDLNPLNHSGNLAAFAADLELELASAIISLQGTAISTLLQCAGVYDFGTFHDHDAARRGAVLGVNVLGSSEVLHAVTSVNRSLGRDARHKFTHILLGSFQGLYTRVDRTLYAASKAYGLDLCSALSRSEDIARSIYIAAGPIDTSMLHRNHWVAKLHRNHWVAKARGSPAFYDRILGRNDEVYDAIFVDCDQDAFRGTVEREGGTELEQLQTAFSKYRVIRTTAFRSELGVLAPNECSAVLHQIINREDLSSGIYMVTAPRGVLALRMVKFEELDRRKAFDAVAKPVILEAKNL